MFGLPKSAGLRKSERTPTRAGRPAPSAILTRNPYMYATGGYDTICSNFLFPLGSPNTFSCSSLCNNAHRVMAPVATFGSSMIISFRILREADRIVVWGSNPATDSPPIHLNEILEAKRRGVKVAVIDPLKTFTQRRRMNGWNPARNRWGVGPWIIHVMIEKGLYDTAFADDWTLGFGELREYVRKFLHLK